MRLQARIEASIQAQTGKPARITQSQSAAGGCINDSRILTLQDGGQVFVKTHPQAQAYPGLFEAEYQALEQLAGAAAIRVPKPIAADQDFIVMEAFREGHKSPHWQERIGQQLAQLHQVTRTDRFGFDGDNYLGTSVQPNGWMDSWVDFWRARRLGWQLELFAQHGSDAHDPLLKLGYQLMERLDDMFALADEPAVLLHGDLWAGNASADEHGEPIIFDPASYYGHREAEIGMMRLFGGFDARCEAAYQEVWPLAEGAERRIDCYRLYHQLNHLNLFGRGYYQGCMVTLNRLTRC